MYKRQALQSPIINAAKTFENLLTNVGIQFLQMSGSGLNLDNDGEPFEFSIEPASIELNEETDSDLRGDVTFLMPSGITLENFQTANGWEEIDEVDGRQRITMSLESLVAGDEITFSVKVSWWYVLSQIWIYPTIILSLIVWRLSLIHI